MIQVEGNINFYEELKKQLNDSKNEIIPIPISNETTDVNTTTVNTTQDDEYIGTCLITNENLTDGKKIYWKICKK